MRYSIFISVIIFSVIFYFLPGTSFFNLNENNNLNKTHQWNEKNTTDFNNLIKESFNKIRHEGSNSSFVIIDFNNEYYIQYMSFKNSNDLYCETVSNEFLSNKYKIDSNGKSKLVKIGFNPPTKRNKNTNKSPNYSKIYYVNKNDNYNIILKELEFIMKEVYGIKNNTDINVKITLE